MMINFALWPKNLTQTTAFVEEHISTHLNLQVNGTNFRNRIYQSKQVATVPKLVKWDAKMIK